MIGGGIRFKRPVSVAPRLATACLGRNCLQLNSWELRSVVRRLAAVTKNRCVVLAASDARGFARAVSAEQMLGRGQKWGL